MEENYTAESLRLKLIIAGINEIDAHGIVGFSLRRVAQSCGASCAAPYRHFENKNGFIIEIIKYINRQWELLENQIIDIYKDDLKKLLVELSLANIRFKLANPDFRAVLMMNEKGLNRLQREEILKMTEKTSFFTRKFCKEKGLSEAEAERKLYIVKSLIYGAVIMTDSGELDGDTMDMVKKSIEEIFDI